MWHEKITSIARQIDSELFIKWGGASWSPLIFLEEIQAPTHSFKAMSKLHCHIAIKPSIARQGMYLGACLILYKG